MGALDGRVAVVTGSGQGVGRGIALYLAQEWAKVVITTESPSPGRRIRSAPVRQTRSIRSISPSGEMPKRQRRRSAKTAERPPCFSGTWGTAAAPGH